MLSTLQCPMFALALGRSYSKSTDIFYKFIFTIKSFSIRFLVNLLQPFMAFIEAFLQ